MSFRLKIALGFCSILLLTLMTAVTGWWALESALHHQGTILSLNVELKRLFHRVDNEESNYRISGKLFHVNIVNSTLQELRETIFIYSDRLRSQDISEVAIVADDLDDYQKKFTSFSQQMIVLETMKSRMISESSRILFNSRELLGDTSPGAIKVLTLVGSMLQAEKDYMLTGSKVSSLAVIKATDDIEKIANLILDSEKGSGLKLRAYRVAKVITIYRDIFNRFVEEQRNLDTTTLTLKDSRESLETKLEYFLEKELESNRQQLQRLKVTAYCILGAGVIIALLMTLLLSTKIVQPLEQLKQSATSIFYGDLSTSVTIKSKDEIGQLGLIFNQMTEKLRENFEEIIRYRDSLEEIVAERTSELVAEIRERSAAEKALKTSEEQLRTVVDQSPMGIILWDTAFTVISWNPAAGNIFGYSEEEAVGMELEKILPAKENSKVKSNWQESAADRSGFKSHNENFHKDGLILLCDWFNAPIHDPDGNVIGILSLVEDVTLHKQTEKELLKLEKLESTGILAGGIAHDFNNILTAILGSINVALMDESLRQNTRKLLGSAEKASLRAKTLTQQLLTFAKGGEPIRETTSLAEIIEDSSSFVLHGGNVSCRYNIPEDLLHAVVDKGQISQVIQNIVLNSRHAMPDGGRITIGCKNVTKESEAFELLEFGKDYVKISIRDHGTGIPSKMVDKIFDPYFSTKQEGSGLGLAITLSIITKHNGHILVNSEPNEGTEFIIYLPAVHPKEKKPEALSYVTGDKSVHKILVMDDDESVQMIVNDMLTSMGHIVCLTCDGEEAVALYKKEYETEEPFDLVIFDLTVPGGMGGKEAMRRLEKIDPNIRGIVSSGYSNDPVMALCRQYGFSATIAKPFTLKEMERTIHQVTSQPHKIAN